MDIFEITGNETGVSRAGVNFLQPADSYQNLQNGFIYRQVLQSRQGIGYFAPRLAGETRVFGIFEHTLPDTSKKLLAVDQNYLYKYNTATGVFDQVAFGGTLLASGYAGFNISQKDYYVSGTSYPTADNLGRFVFTGHGMSTLLGASGIFFYDDASNTVMDDANTTDNTNYAAPIGGALTKPDYVFWFGERLNFVNPIIAGIQFNQMMLFSGIRTTSGNGDKFNVAGSGDVSIDTYENITGASILGQVIAINADRSNWIIEKTRDAFNPYFTRKIPSVLGTNAAFSAVSWNDTVKSIGKTGIIETDSRQSLRGDNKIPYFTRDEMDQKDFNLTYGGFDRLNNQFLWAFKELEADTDTQNKVLVNNYEEDTWSVYDQRFSVFGQTDVGIDLAWNQIEAASGNPSWGRWDTTEDIWDRIGLGEQVQKTLAGDDLGFIYELNQDFDDYFATISGVTNAAQCVVTINATAFKAGDKVVIQNVGGMLDSFGVSGINNFDTTGNLLTKPVYTIVSRTDTSLTLDHDTTLLTAYTAATGTISKVISFRAETIPFNPYRDQGRRVVVSHVEFLIDNNGGSLLVDVLADEEEAPFKQNILLQPDSESTKARQWITMTVKSEANFFTFVMKQESPAVQLRITSMRIHCKAGGLTSG